jgi:2-oxoglutarate ferredoxin oxidoreductase subunit delta
MAKVSIDKNKCKGCYLCVPVCPKASLVIEPELNKKGFQPVAFKQGGECIGCCMCARMCPDCCIVVEKT